jgi:hypothetical protein
MKSDQKIILEITTQIAAALITRPADPNTAKFSYDALPEMIARRARQYAVAILKVVTEDEQPTDCGCGT